jgi:hypothetical protein
VGENAEERADTRDRGEQAGRDAPNGHRDPSTDTLDTPLRSIVGAGRSRLTPTVAMRARDVARPDEADLATAERELVIRHARPQPARPIEQKRVRRGVRGRMGEPGAQLPGDASWSADGEEDARDRS